MKKETEKIDWNKFLNKENITEEEWIQACELSENWVTCAVGNLCDRIPRLRSGCPEDSRLFNLGSDFMIDISNRNKIQAKATLLRIEERSQVILNNMSL